MATRAPAPFAARPNHQRGERMSDRNWSPLSSVFAPDPPCWPTSLCCPVAAIAMSREETTISATARGMFWGMRRSSDDTNDDTNRLSRWRGRTSRAA